MISEKKTQIRVILKGLLIVLFASLYAWGGMEYKWLRRFLAPSLLCIGLLGFSRDWRYLLQVPLMMATLCLGYGSDMVAIKVLKRLVFGLANGTSSSAVLIWKFWRKPSNALGVVITVQLILTAGLITVFGVLNPMPSARAEEFLIGMIIALVPTLSVRDYDSPTE